MSATISKKKGSIAGAYIKRTAGLITGAAGSYFSEAMPTTDAVLTGATSTISGAAKSLTSGVKGVLPKFREIKAQSIFKNINEWFLTAADDFDSGAEASLSGFDIEDVEDSEIASAQLSEAEKNTNRLGKSIVESSHKLAETQALSTANITSSIDAQTAIISKGFDTTNKLLQELVEITTKNTSTLIEATVASNAQRDSREEMLGKGRFSFDQYKKIVGKNIENSELGMILPYLSMIKDGSWKQLATPEAIVSMAFSGIVNKAAPKLQKNMEAIDESVNNVIMNALIRIGNNQKSGTLGSIGRLLGISAGRENIDTSRNSVELKSISWDTVSKEYLTNAIPGYLRKILVQLGGPDVIYDARSRTFRTQNEIKRDFEEATTTLGTLNRSSSRIRKGLYRDGASRGDMQMYYDLIMQDLGSNYSDADMRDKIDSLRSKRALAEYIRELTKGMQIDKIDLKHQNQFINNFAETLNDEWARIDVSNQAHSTEVRRQQAGQAYVDRANQMNVDLSDFSDSSRTNHRAIFDAYDRVYKEDVKDEDGATVKEQGPATAAVGGIDYANRALYEIYRRLETGINVFKVGEFTKKDKDKMATKPYKKKKALMPPPYYSAKNIFDDSERQQNSGGGASISSTDPNKYDDGINDLQNNTDKDGNKEDLSKGERFARWGKKRGRQFAGAVFNGSPDDVREVISAAMTDITEVAGDEAKKGLKKINDSFGNVSGYLKHKLFGTEYEYKDKDENGNEVIKKVAKNDKGGIFGFVTEEFKSLFSKSTEGAKSWWNDVKGYFDFLGDDDDDEEKGIGAKRKKLIGTSVGAFLGSGLFGGPIGLVVGALAGNALSATGLGKKLKDYLFGVDKKGKATGLLNRAADKILRPLQFQIGKTLSFTGAALKKHVLGPLSDLGLAIKDRMTTHIEGLLGFLTKPFKSIGKGIAKAGAKLVGGIASGAHKLGTSLLGKSSRGLIGVAGSFIEGVQRGITRSFSKNSYHKLAKGEIYFLLIGDKFYDPSEEREGKKGKDRNCVHELTAQMKHGDDLVGPIEELGGQLGVILNGDRPNEWRPLTRDYLKRRRKKRNKDVDEKLHKSGYYEKGGIFGFLGGDYKKWVENQDKKRADRKKRFDEATAEGETTTAEKTEEVAENTASIAENTKNVEDILNEERIEGSSFKTHDQGLWDRADYIITLLGGDPKYVSKFGKNKAAPKVEDKQEGATVAKDKEAEDKELARTALLSTTQAAMSGDNIDRPEMNNLNATLNEATADHPKKATIRERLRNMFRMQKDGKDEAGEKGESFLSKLIGGIGEKIGSFWPLILGGLALLNDGVRDWVINTALPGVANWLTTNLPGIIGSAWKLIKDGAKEVNQAIYNAATGSHNEVDEVTGENVSVRDAETFAEQRQQGLWKTAFQTATNPLETAKNVLIGTGIRKGAGAILSATGIGSGAVSIGAGVLNTGVKFGQSAAFFGSNFGKKGAFGWAKNYFNNVAEGSKVLSAVQKGSAAVSEGATDLASSTTLSRAANAAKGTKVASIAGAATSFIVGTGSTILNEATNEYMNMARHGNIVGDYGLGDAAGFKNDSPAVATVTANLAGQGAGIVAGMAVKAAIAKAGLFAAGGLMASNPVGWVIGIIAAAVLLAAGITALVNAVSHALSEKGNKEYSIRSNATKLYSVINGKISYEDSTNNAKYIYMANDSDRVLGLTAGMYIRDPELTLGAMMYKIVEGLATVPGCEVMLYDFINNMAVQGVPFAVRMAGDSEKAPRKGAQANSTYADNLETTSTNWYGGEKVQVLKSTVDKYEDEILIDIQTNIARNNSDYIWDYDGLDAVYDAGRKVFNWLKDKNIINNKGEVKPKMFSNYTPTGDKNSTSNGWDILISKVQNKDDMYFFLQCLAYINSKIDVDDKTKEQWMQKNQDKIGKCLEIIRQNLGIDPTAELSDDSSTYNQNLDINGDTIKNDPAGTKAQETGAIVSQPTPPVNATLNKSVPEKDRADVQKELEYVTASYMYSHPEILQKWVDKVGENSGILSVDDRKNISRWNTISDSKDKKRLMQEMADASLTFAKQNGDIFDILSRFDWSENSYLFKKTGIWPFNESPVDSYGAGFVVRGDKKKPGKGRLDEIWDDGEIGDVTPTQMHQTMTGSTEHGQAAEDPNGGDVSFYPTAAHMGVLGGIGQLISWYANDKDQEKYQNDGPTPNPEKNAMVALTPANPKDMPTGIGGPSNWNDEEERLNGGATISTSNEHNPLNKDFTITSPYGYRDIGDGTEFHPGIDIVPQDGTGKATVGATNSGTIIDVRRDISNDHTGLGVKTDQEGNYVSYQTNDGTIIKNMHLKEGSIPSGIQPGASINTGDKLGEMGSTGRSDGAHLHYQVENPSTTDNTDGNTIDPSQYLGLTSSNDTGTVSISDDGAIISSNPDTETNKATGILGVLNTLKSAGYQILSKLTGGLISADGTSDDGSSSIADFGSSGSVTGGSYDGSTVESVEQFLDIVRGEIGVAEIGTSNRVKYGEWYGMNGSPWCMMFVQWCFNEAGLKLEYRTASCSSLLSYYQSNHPNQVGKAGASTPKPGDIAIFTNSGGKISHTGIIEKVASNSSVTTIEGNTSSTSGGSQDNGGCVARKNRTTTPGPCSFAYFIRPVDFERLEREAKARATAMANISEGSEGVFMYLKGLGYTDEAAAAIVGCFEPESGSKSKRVEYDYGTPFKDIGGSKEASYDAIQTNRDGTDRFVQALFDQYQRQNIRINRGAYESGGHLYPGMGYAQWTGPRAKKLIEYAQKNKMKWYDPGVQLSYLDQELNGAYSSVRSDINATSSLDEATHRFAYGFENGNMPATQYADRIAAAKSIYSKYKGKYKPSESTATSAISTASTFAERNEENIRNSVMYTGDKEQTSTISTPNWNNNHQFNIGGPITKKKTSNISNKIGGPTNNTSEYRSDPRIIEAGTNTQNNNITSGDRDKSLDRVLDVLTQMVSTLIDIRDNTGTSSDLLGSINEKDFVDQGLRNSISALGKTTRSKTQRHSTSSSNATQVTSMARP